LELNRSKIENKEEAETYVESRYEKVDLKEGKKHEPPGTSQPTNRAENTQTCFQIERGSLQTLNDEEHKRSRKGSNQSFQRP